MNVNTATTINLIQDNPSVVDIQTILDESTKCSLFPNLGDTDWTPLLANPLMAQTRQQIETQAFKELDTELPPLTDALYCSYSTGVRFPFEKVYFERRRLLGRAAFSLLCQPTNKDLRDSFIHKLDGVAREESWALPAHVESIDGRDPMCIDLFCAETANQMGVFLNTFADIIPGTLAHFIRERLIDQIIDNYLNQPERFWWATTNSNWNSVCHQGVLGAGLAILEDNNKLAQLLKTGTYYLSYFLEGFKDDGACQEGPGYWTYGFGWFAKINDQLEARTAGRLSLFQGDEKIRKIAEYGPAVCLSNRYLVNFADSTRQDLLSPSLFQDLAQRLQIPSCQRQAEANYAYVEQHGIDMGFLRADIDHFLRLFYYAPQSIQNPDAIKPDTYFQNLEVWIVQGRDRAGHLWEVAAKGGHNEEHHNHNDVGSFLLNIDGEPMLIEIGSEEYTRSYFQNEYRYRYLATRSLGHSLPIVNGCEESFGASYKGSVETADIQKETVSFSIEFSQAYPREAACNHLNRKLTLEKEIGRLTLEDTFGFQSGGSYESAFITDATDVVIESSECATIQKDGRCLQLTCSPASYWDRIETLSYKDHQSGSPRPIRRLVLAPVRRSLQGKYQVEMTLR